MGRGNPHRIVRELATDSPALTDNRAGEASVSPPLVFVSTGVYAYLHVYTPVFLYLFNSQAPAWRNW